MSKATRKAAIEFISEMRDNGLSDQQIADNLGLTHVNIGETAKRVREGLASGLIKQSDTYYSMAKKLGIDHPYKVKYQLNRLKKEGKL